MQLASSFTSSLPVITDRHPSPIPFHSIPFNSIHYHHAPAHACTVTLHLPLPTVAAGCTHILHSLTASWGREQFCGAGLIIMAALLLVPTSTSHDDALTRIEPRPKPQPVHSTPSPHLPPSGHLATAQREKINFFTAPRPDDAFCCLARLACSLLQPPCDWCDGLRLPLLCCRVSL